MSLPTSRMLNGVIGLSMLAMFTVAIVAGQARANLGPYVQTAMDAPQSIQISHKASATLTLPLQDIRHIKALPAIVNTLLDLPIDIDINMATGQITATSKQPLAGHE